MILTFQPKQSHWYGPDGRPCHEVPRADGKGMKATTLREARQQNLYPSVTSILKVLAKDSLTDWRISQAILAAMTLPRLKDETDTDFANRVVIDMDAQAKEAARFGSALHSAAEQIHLGHEFVPVSKEDFKVKAHIKDYERWFKESVKDVIHAEKVLVNNAEGYAGCVDLVCVLRDDNKAVVDLKTQGVKAKPVFYDEWALQLSAYQHACQDAFFSSTIRLSVIINSLEPSMVAVKEWPNHQEDWEAFKNCCRLWRYLKKYPNNV